MANTGLFITFEGIDGCGKSTVLNSIAEFLTAKGFDVVKTREPGALKLGSQIREILLHYDGHVSDNCELFLFLADRAQHVDTLIKPSIKEGKIVLCDRHVDSTVAYQGYGRQKDVEKLINLNKIATDSLEPDMTILLDLDVKTALQRAGSTDRMEASGTDFFERTRNGYLELSRMFSNRFRVIDGNNTKEVVYNLAKKFIIELLQSKGLYDDRK